MKLEILRFPNPKLRKKGIPVAEVTSELKELGKAMLELMYTEKGVGLAAIQVGKPVRLLVADTRKKDESSTPYDESQNILSSELESQINQPLILYNPKVVDKQGSVIFQEGCLSFPSYAASVQRAKICTVEALDINSKPIQIKTDGLLSICLQHEIDHLDGKLFIDHLSPIKAQALRDEIKKYGYPENAR